MDDFDAVPISQINQNKQNSAPIQQRAEADYSALDLGQKIEHKDWKARAAGYDEILKCITKNQDDKKSTALVSNNIKKFLMEPIAPAQEKSVEIVSKICANFDFNKSLVHEICESICKKCFGSKPKIKENAIKIISTVAEYEFYEFIHEPLIEFGLKNKTPTIVMSTIELYISLLENFGTKCLDLKPLAPALISLAENRTSSVRESNKNLIALILHWFGINIKPLFSKIDETKMNQIESELEKMQNNPRKPKSCFISQAVANNTLNDNKIDSQDDEESLKSIENNIDPFDIADPVNILQKISNSFFSLIQSDKWKERKEAVDNALNACENVLKIAYDNKLLSLIDSLKNIIAKDKNIVVVIQAANALKLILMGVRSQYKSQNDLIVPIQERLKEKKPSFVAALSEVLIQGCKYCPDQSAFILSSIEHAKPNSNPALKNAVLAYNIQFLKDTENNIMSQNFLKSFVPHLLSMTNDSSGDVRDASYMLLAICCKMGHKVEELHLKALDEKKLTKIHDFETEIEIKAKKLKQTKTDTYQKPMPIKKAPVSKSKKSDVPNEAKSCPSNSEKEHLKKPSISKNNSSYSKNIKKTQTVESLLNSNELVSKFKTTKPDQRLNFTSNLISEIAKLKNENQNQTEINNLPTELIDFITRRLSESNKNLVQTVLNLLRTVSQDCSQVCKKKLIEMCFTPVMLCFGDLKLPVRKQALECTNSLVASANEFALIKSDQWKYIFKTDNKHLIVELFGWLKSEFDEFEISANKSISSIFPEFSKSLNSILILTQHKNNEIRSAALNFVEFLICKKCFDSKCFLAACKKIGKSKITEIVKNFIQEVESSQKEQIKKDSTSASNPTNNENDSMCSQTISQIQKMSVTSDLQSAIRSNRSPDFEKISNNLLKFFDPETVNTLINEDFENLTSVFTLISDFVMSDKEESQDFIIYHSEDFFRLVSKYFSLSDDDMFENFTYMILAIFEKMKDIEFRMSENLAKYIFKAIIKLMTDPKEEAQKFCQESNSLFYEIASPSIIISLLLRNLNSRDDTLKLRILEELLYLLQRYNFTAEDIAKIGNMELRRPCYLLDYKNSPEIADLSLKITSLFYFIRGDDILNVFRLKEEKVRKIVECSNNYKSDWIHGNTAQLNLSGNNKSFCSISMHETSHVNVKNDIATTRNPQHFITNSTPQISRQLSNIDQNVLGSTQPMNSTFMQRIDDLNSPDFVKIIDNDDEINIEAKNSSKIIQKTISDSLKNNENFENTNSQDLKINNHFYTIDIHPTKENIEHLRSLQKNLASQSISSSLIAQYRIWISLTGVSIKNLTNLNSDKKILKQNSSCIKGLIEISLEMLGRGEILKFMCVEILSEHLQVLLTCAKNLANTSNKLKSELKNHEDTNEGILQQHFSYLIDYVDRFINIFSFHPNLILIPIINCLNLFLVIENEQEDALNQILIKRMSKSLGKIQSNPKQIYLPTILIATDTFLENYIKAYKTSQNKNVKINSWSMKIIKFMLTNFVQTYDSFLTTQLNLCEPDMTATVSHYIAYSRKKLLVPSNATEKISETDISISLTSANSNLDLNASDSVSNPQNSQSKIESFNNSEYFYQLKQKILNPETCEEAVKQFWIQVNLMKASKNCMQNFDTMINDFLSDIRYPLIDYIKSLISLYDVLKPTEDLPALNISDLSVFQKSMKQNYFEQAGKLAIM